MTQLDSDLDSPRSVCFFTGTMSVFAGAERVTAVIANALAARGWRVHILCQYGPHSVFELAPGVSLHALHTTRPSFRRHYIGTVLQVRRFLKLHRINALVDVDTNLAWFTVPACIGLNVRHMAWEHTHFAEDLGLRARRIARRMAAHCCDAVVVLTERDRAAWQEALGDMLRRGASLNVIPNPLTLPRPPQPVDGSNRTVLAVGRLEHVKGFDLLLHAWRLVQDALAGDSSGELRSTPFAENERTDGGPTEAAGGDNSAQAGWTLRIVGDGSQREALLTLRCTLGLEASVEFQPATADIDHHYASASVFALSSRYEGFGLVLIEAMAHGLAIVAFDCETGPRELIAHEHNGLLVKAESAEALARGLSRMLREPALRKRLTENAYTESEKYDVGRLAERWEALLSGNPASRITFLTSSQKH